MKFLFCLLAGMLSLGLAAQKPFEGTIRYVVFFSAIPSDSVDVSISFGPGKALLRVHERNGRLESDMLIDADSGYVHTLYAAEKTYRTKKLRAFEDKQQIPPGNKTILGYTAKGVNLARASSSMKYMGLGLADKAVVYAADDLLFPVPEKYEANMELMFVHKGRILLGGELTIGMDYGYEEEYDESTVSPMFFFEAREIIRQPVDPALLRIPAGYEKWSKERMQMHWDSTAVPDSAYILDSTVVVMEDTSFLEEIPPPPPPKPQAKKPAAKKTPAKKPAVKTGTSGTKKQAARKPE